MKQEVRRDRVGVLASTIVKELAAARVKEIERESVESPDPPVVVTAPMKQLLRKYVAGKKRKKEAEKAIEKMGYRIADPYEGEPSIERPHVRYNEREARLKAARAERSRRVKQMRTEALIDLVTLDPAHAKAAVQKFRAAIEAV